MVRQLPQVLVVRPVQQSVRTGRRTRREHSLSHRPIAHRIAAQALCASRSRAAFACSPMLVAACHDAWACGCVPRYRTGAARARRACPERVLLACRITCPIHAHFAGSGTLLVHAMTPRSGCFSFDSLYICPYGSSRAIGAGLTS